MNISGIRPSIGFYDYNGIKKTDLQAVAAPETTTEAKNSPQAAGVAQRSPEVEAKQTFGAYDYASQYKPDATYSLKGEMSDIRSLDVEKAISDMQKDEVLHQYQFFVGSEIGASMPAAASKRGAEDFSL